MPAGILCTTCSTSDIYCVNCTSFSRTKTHHSRSPLQSTSTVILCLVVCRPHLPSGLQTGWQITFAQDIYRISWRDLGVEVDLICQGKDNRLHWTNPTIWSTLCFDTATPHFDIIWIYNNKITTIFAQSPFSGAGTITEQKTWSKLASWWDGMMRDERLVFMSPSHKSWMYLSSYYWPEARSLEKRHLRSERSYQWAATAGNWKVATFSSCSLSSFIINLL